MTPMTPEEFEKKMKECFDSRDVEMNHADADDLMCELLENLGYEAGVKIFNSHAKWYA